MTNHSPLNNPLDPVRPYADIEHKWSVIRASLWQYGYYGDEEYEEIKSFKRDASRSTDAVTLYQETQSLNDSPMRIDGDAGEVTTKHILQDRCGCRDITPAGAEAASQQWPRSCMREITISHTFTNLKGRSLLKGLTGEQAATAFQLAVTDWNSQCGLDAKVVSKREREHHIWVEVGKTNTNTLAWAYLANGRCDTVLQMRFGRHHTWSPFKFREVAGHELGHCYGLSHGTRRSLMNATALGLFNPPVPQPEDIKRVVDRYGKPIGGPPPPAPPIGDKVMATWEFAGETFQVLHKSGGSWSGI